MSLTPTTRIGSKNSEAKVSRIEYLSTFLLLLYAIWTLLAHVVVFSSGNFHDLQRLAVLVPFLGSVLFYLIYRPFGTWVQKAEAAGKPLTPDWNGLAISLVLVGLYEAALLYFPSGRFHVFWAAAMLFLVVSWWRLPVGELAGESSPPPTRTRDILVFGVLVLAAALIAISAQHPDADDVFYLNMAVMTVDAPDKALLSWDGMHWGQNLPLHLPIYRIHSYELLCALLASLTHIEPIRIAHVWLPPVFAIWMVMAQSLLLRYLLPTQWVAALVLVFLLTLAVGGEVDAGFANVSLIQLRFGKFILVAVVLPLLTLFALRAVQQSQRRNWFLLFFGQVAALGLSSTALFAAPLAVGVGLLAAWRPSRLHNRRVILGVLSSGYIVGVGLVLRAMMVKDVVLPPDLRGPNDFLLKVLGQGPHLWLYLWTLVGAWTVVTDANRRRLMLGLALFFMGLVMNPFLQSIYAKYITGSTVFWRIYWVIPLPIMAAVGLLALLTAWTRRRYPTELLGLLVAGLLFFTESLRWRTYWSTALSVVLGLLFLLAVMRFMGRHRLAVATIAVVVFLATLIHFDGMRLHRRTVVAAANHTQWRFADLKVSPPDYAAAQQAVALAPLNGSVLAPSDLSILIPTIRGAPLLLVTRPFYLTMLTPFLGAGAVHDRLALFEYVSGHSRVADAPRLLLEAVGRFQLGLVIIHPTNPWVVEVDGALQSAGLHKQLVAGYLFYLPTPLGREWRSNPNGLRDYGK